jgi:hypothetical protein
LSRASLTVLCISRVSLSFLRTKHLHLTACRVVLSTLLRFAAVCQNYGGLLDWLVRLLQSLGPDAVAARALLRAPPGKSGAADNADPWAVADVDHAQEVAQPMAAQATRLAEAFTPQAEKFGRVSLFCAALVLPSLAPSRLHC